MLQPRQDRALARNALGQAAIHPFRARQLERRGALHDPVGSLREPDGPHAAFAQQALQPPRSDAVSRLLGPHRGDGIACHPHHRRRRGQIVGEAGDLGLREQLLQQGLQMRGFGRQGLEPAAAVGSIECETRFQQPVQPVPVLDRQPGRRSHGEVPPPRQRRKPQLKTAAPAQLSRASGAHSGLPTARCARAYPVRAALCCSDPVGDAKYLRPPALRSLDLPACAPHPACDKVTPSPHP